MIIELDHGIPGFDNDEIKDILYYISTTLILTLSILFYFNKCTATDQIDCVYIRIKMLSQQLQKHQNILDLLKPHVEPDVNFLFIYVCQSIYISCQCYLIAITVCWK